MIDERMQEALNEQINAELDSAYLYYSMSAYFESQGLPGMANWMRAQALEEMTHVDKFYKYVNERGGRVVLGEIKAPPMEWANPYQVFAATHEHEQRVTALINGLVDIAIDLRDHATNNFLQWFVAEQVEEESTAAEIARKLKLVQDSPSALFMMDRELAGRPMVNTAAQE